MIKFCSSCHELEVVEINCTARRRNSSAGFARINVEIIQQLEHRGVPLSVFEDLLHCEHAKIRDAFNSPSALREVVNSGFDRSLSADPVSMALAGA